MPLAIREIKSLGDSALVVEFKPVIDVAVHQQVLALQRGLDEAAWDAITFRTPACCSLGIGFDPGRIDQEELVARLWTLAARTDSDPQALGGRSWTVPVCYEEELGVDLPEVARFTGRSAEAVIALHLSVTYRVYMLGFLPGFAYLGTLPAELACPRRAEARTQVPAGAVAIAGQQTAIYPAVSPGGWHVLGQTSFRPFDPDAADPFRFQAGDEVRFERVSRTTFERGNA